jgi:uncharacterized membrane protein YbaN (DUF454 family)
VNGAFHFKHSENIVLTLSAFYQSSKRFERGLKRVNEHFRSAHWMKYFDEILTFMFFVLLVLGIVYRFATFSPFLLIPLPCQMEKNENLIY